MTFVAAAPDAAGDLVVGWRQQADFLKAKYGGVPLWKRKRGVAWRGRTQDPEHPKRDQLRRAALQSAAPNAHAPHAVAKS